MYIRMICMYKHATIISIIEELYIHTYDLYVCIHTMCPLVCLLVNR